MVIGLIILIAVFLVACSPQAEAAMDKSATEIVTQSSDDMQEDTMSESAMDETASGMEDDMSMEKSEAEMEDRDVMDEEDGAMEKDEDGEMNENDDDMMESDNEDMSSDDQSMDKDEDNDMMEDGDEEMQDESSMMTPDWFDTSLVNARTGETFTVSDFKGKVVLVETLAMWCSNCLRQQIQVLDLHDMLGERDDFVSLGIDIDPNENIEALEKYIKMNGFNWTYTVAPVETAREISQLYGDQYLNPPSTPMLIIDRNGEVHLLPFGVKSAESLYEALQPFLENDM
jgi:cytochrome oxidase Cu insertion factor (SCO1/SenC/PrrC family)